LWVWRHWWHGTRSHHTWIHVLFPPPEERLLIHRKNRAWILCLELLSNMLVAAFFVNTAQITLVEIMLVAVITTAAVLLWSAPFYYLFGLANSFVSHTEATRSEYKRRRKLREKIALARRDAHTLVVTPIQKAALVVKKRGGKLLSPVAGRPTDGTVEALGTSSPAAVVGAVVVAVQAGGESPPHAARLVAHVEDSETKPLTPDRSQCHADCGAVFGEQFTFVHYGSPEEKGAQIDAPNVSSTAVTERPSDAELDQKFPDVNKLREEQEATDRSWQWISMSLISLVQGAVGVLMMVYGLDLIIDTPKGYDYDSVILLLLDGTTIALLALGAFSFVRASRLRLALFCNVMSFCCELAGGLILFKLSIEQWELILIIVGAVHAAFVALGMVVMMHIWNSYRAAYDRRRLQMKSYERLIGLLRHWKVTDCGASSHCLVARMAANRIVRAIRYGWSFLIHCCWCCCCCPLADDCVGFL
jgi:hypothetical protein